MGASIVVIFVAASLGLAVYVQWRRRDEWIKAARKLGLSVDEDGLADRRIQGRFGRRGLSVVVEKIAEGDGSKDRITVYGVPAFLGVKRRSVFSLLGGAGEATRDPTFDARFISEGSDETVHAALTSDQRLRVERLFEEGKVSLGNGELSVDVTNLVRAKTIIHLVSEMAAIVEDFQDAAGATLARLARNAARDPVAAVRARNLELFIRGAEQGPARTEALERAVLDKEAEVRLLAARALERVEALEQLSFDALVPVHVRVEALEALGGLPTTAEGKSRVESLVRSQTAEMRRAALRVLGGLKHRPSFEAARALTADADVEVAKDAIAALGAIGGTDAEPRLIELLQHADASVRHAAITALKEVGTQRSIDPLAAMDQGLFGDRAGRDLADDATQAIHARSQRTRQG